MTNDNNSRSFGDDFKRRVKAVKTTRWIRFAVVAAIFTAWVAWLGSCRKQTHFFSSILQDCSARVQVETSC